MRDQQQTQAPQIISFTQLGYFHPVYCEDFVAVAEISPGKWVAGVFDGCTMGTESHFASALAGKVLRKVAKEMGYQFFAQPELEAQPLDALGKTFLEQYRQQFRTTASELHLAKEEQLTTVVLAVVDTHAHAVWGICSGDGLVFTSSGLQEYDSGNVPNYMAYHWGKSFEEWLEGHVHVFAYSDVRELTLSTDGVLAFERLDKSLPEREVDVVEFLLGGDVWGSSKTLQKRIGQLEEEYGLIATDDLGVVRLGW